MKTFEKPTPCFCCKPDCYFCKVGKVSYWVYVGLELTTPHDVFNAVCRLTGADPNAIKSNSRKRELAIVRQIYCYVACLATNATKSEIGEVIVRNHATVIHSCRKVKNNMEVKDPITMRTYEKVESILEPKIQFVSNN